MSNNYDEIWFKPHTNRSDVVFTQKGKYLATDLWNFFDGIAWKINGGDGIASLVFLQMKTNAWAKEKPLKDFQKKHNCQIISFNVTDKLKECNGKYKVFARFY